MGIVVVNTEQAFHLNLEMNKIMVRLAQIMFALGIFLPKKMFRSNTGNGTRDLTIRSQDFWPLPYEADHVSQHDIFPEFNKYLQILFTISHMGSG